MSEDFLLGWIVQWFVMIPKSQTRSAELTVTQTWSTAVTWELTWVNSWGHHRFTKWNSEDENQLSVTNKVNLKVILVQAKV